MVENILSMTKSLKGDISQPLLQQLQLARKLESLSKSRDEHILNTAKWLLDNEMVLLRMSTWREIVRVGWIFHRYPVLSQVKLGLSEVKTVLPAVQNLFEKKVERNEPLPDNVIRAQQSRCDAPYLRISLEFPNTPHGDGDGLCDLRVTKLHGLFVNDEKVDCVQEIIFSEGSTLVRSVRTKEFHPIYM